LTEQVAHVSAAAANTLISIMGTWEPCLVDLRLSASSYLARQCSAVTVLHLN